MQAQTVAEAESTPIHQSQKLHQLSSELKKKYVKLDSYIDLILLALLSQQHVLAFGGPGGSKTAVATDIFSAMQDPAFNLQFSPATKEEVIRGVANVQKLLSEAKIEYVSDQSLLMFSYALLDELDKANPETLAALLSVLNERMAMLGDKKVAGKLKTALITSNMTVYEFLQKFRATNDGPTGMALLDRVPFKVLVSNRLPDAEDLYDIYCAEKEPCHLPQDIQLDLLVKQVKEMQIPHDVALLSLHLWQRLQRTLGRECDAGDPTAENPYTTTNQFTNRGAGVMLNILKAAKALHEIQQDPSVDLKQVKWQITDIGLSHGGMILQGPGQMQLGTMEHPVVNPAGDLTGYEDAFEFDPRMKKMLQDLRLEREKFAEVYWEVLKEYLEELQDLALPPEMAELKTGTGGGTGAESAGEKELLLKEMATIKQKIAEKRRKEKITPDREGKGIKELARVKVLQQMADLKFKLQVEEKELQESLLKIETEKILKEQEVQLIKQREEDKIKGNTRSGAVFKRIYNFEINNHLGVTWQDPTGLMWGSIVNNATGHLLTAGFATAKAACEAFGPGYRLPNLLEAMRLVALLSAGKKTKYKAEVIENLEMAKIWVDEKFSPFSPMMYTISGETGKLSQSQPESTTINYLCVYKAP